jgi:formamidopyrimidine-DNA glycosylase
VLAHLSNANHTLKRALTDPKLFAGIGNAILRKFPTLPIHMK